MKEKFSKFCDDYADVLMDIAAGDIDADYLVRLCKDEGVSHAQALRVVNDYKRILFGKWF